MTARPDPFRTHVADQVLAALAAAPGRCPPRRSRTAPVTACATGSWSTGADPALAAGEVEKLGPRAASRSTGGALARWSACPR